MKRYETFPEWYRDLTLREPLLNDLATLGFLHVVHDLKKHEVPTLVSLTIRAQNYLDKRKEVFGDIEILW